MVEEVQAKSANRIQATGKRKEAKARVYLFPGTGNVTVNKRAFDNYFTTETLRLVVMQPFVATDTKGKYDVIANLTGGGVVAQAGALKHGISRAIARIDESKKVILRRNGFLTRDSRMKERKKYGQKGARRRFQFTKR